ncbi:MAG: glycosyl transferase family 1 [Pirellulaceae bacterium]|nr:MAG: glycosyl transferase family 1 [Pirellulaceae bacterium]
MRIAHVITRMIVGGAQENTLLCCQDLLRHHGDQVLLITGPSLGPEGDLLATFPDHGVPVERIGCLRRPIHPGRDVLAYWQLKRVLRNFRPDVVHTHSAKGGFLGRLAAWKLRVPVVVHTVHGAPFHPYQPWWVRSLFRWCERYAARRCHKMISVADAMTHLLVEAGVAPREKFVTIYSGMQIEPFLEATRARHQVRRRLGWGEEHLVIGKIARLFRLKGHDDLVQAAKVVVRRYPQARFLLVGDGILRDALQRKIARAGLSAYFHFTGLVAPDQIASWIGAMDILVHCSLREGLARALPQALLAGIPVVSYDVDGAREVVLDGTTGYLVAPRDTGGLIKALLALLADPERRRAMGEHGRRLCITRFRHETMTAAIRQLYEQLLAEAQKGEALNR